MPKVIIKPGTDLNTLGELLLIQEQRYDSKVEELLKQAKIDPKKPLSLPPVCLSLIGSDGKEGIIGSLGDFSLVIGKAKSKKTFCISMFLASMVQSMTTQERIKGELPIGKKRVIFFDTEQSEFHVQKVLHRVFKIIGSTPEHFEAYCLRKFTPGERLQLIDTAIQSIPDLGFVAIDGIRDLVTSINDEEEATKIASFILKWTQEKQIHIIAALHQNKGDLNARGHLGTELVNKAQTVLSVSRDPNNKNISIVEAEFCRDSEPETFAFYVDEEELPQIIAGFIPNQLQKGGRPRKDSPQDMASKFHWDFLGEVFRDLPQPNGTTIKNCIISRFGIGTNRAGEYLTYYEKEGWIKREGNKNSPKCFFTLELSSTTD